MTRPIEDRDKIADQPKAQPVDERKKSVDKPSNESPAREQKVEVRDDTIIERKREVKSDEAQDHKSAAPKIENKLVNWFNQQIASRETDDQTELTLNLGLSYEKFSLLDASQQQEFYKKIKEFINFYIDHPRIIAIKIPADFVGQAFEKYQQELVAINIGKQKLQKISGKPIAADEQNLIKQRRKILLSSEQIEASTEQEQEQEEMVSLDQDIDAELDKEVKALEAQLAESEAMDCKAFINAVRNKELTLPIDWETDEESLHSYWNQLLGVITIVENSEEKETKDSKKESKDSKKDQEESQKKISIENPRANRISRAAIQKLLKHAVTDIDLDHVPQGFVIKNQVLNYYIELDFPSAAYSDVTMVLTSVEEKKEAKTQEVIDELFTLFNKYKDQNAKNWLQMLSLHHRGFYPGYSNNLIFKHFKYFMERLGDLGSLKLPPFDMAIFGKGLETVNMPIILGRILTILEHCAPEDRQGQLNLIPKLDLSSTGAIRALYDNPPPRFIHPAMQCQAENYGKKLGYRAYKNTNPAIPDEYFDETYRSTSLVHGATNSALAVETTFWRIISHQDCLPLSFYLGKDGKSGAIAQIETRFQDPFVKAMLYENLAALSSGVGLVYNRNPEEVTLKWQQFCDLMFDITKGMGVLAAGAGMFINKDKIRTPILEKLHELVLLPPGQLLAKIIILAKNCVATGKSQELFVAFHRLNVLLRFLSRADIDKRSIYYGMRFTVAASEEKYATDPYIDPNSSLFFSYLNKLELIRDFFEDESIDRSDFTFLVQSHETFGLEISDMAQFITHTIRKPDTPNIDQEFSYFKDVSLNLLNQIHNRNGLTKEILFTGIFPTLNALFTEFNDGFLEDKYGEKLARDFLDAFQSYQEICRTKGDNDAETIAAEEKAKYCKKQLSDYKKDLLNEKIIRFIDYLQARFPNNFPADFLDKQRLKYVVKKQDPKIAEEIAKLFSTTEQQQALNQILSLHTLPEDLAVQKQTILLFKKLSVLAIYKDNPRNFTILLKNWAQYEATHTHQHTLAELNQFLDLIVNNQHSNPHLLETLLYQPNIASVSHLVQKGIMLYDHIDPWLIANKKRIAPQKTYAAAMDVFLAIPEGEIARSYLPADIDSKAMVLAEDKDIDILQQAAIKASSPSLEKINRYVTSVANLLASPIYQDNHQLLQIQDILARCKKAKLYLTKKSEQLEKKEPESVQPQEVKKEKTSLLEDVRQGWNNFKSFLSKSEPKPPSTTSSVTKQKAKLIEAPDLEMERAVDDLRLIFDNSELIRNFIRHHHLTYKQQYTTFLKYYYDHIYQLIENYHDNQQIEKSLLKYISYFVNLDKNKNEDQKKEQKETKQQTELKDQKQGPEAKQKEAKEQEKSYARTLLTQIELLEKASQHLSAQEMQAVLYYYRQPPAHPQELIEILAKIESAADNKKFLYHLFAKLVGKKTKINEQDDPVAVLTVASFTKLQELLHNNTLTPEDIQRWYNHPPYKPLDQLISLLLATPKERYPHILQEYNQTPFARDPSNIFDIKIAKQQAKSFTENEYLTTKNIETLQEYITKYRELSTSEKIKLLAAFRNLESKQEVKEAKADSESKVTHYTAQIRSLSKAQPEYRIALSALMGELLYSTTGDELNTTQFLTEFNALMNDENMTHQVATGGGKSRISMTVCAAKAILGDTIDFVTSSMALAEREYYATKPFFEACGINTQIITANTPFSEYLNNGNGINFSSPDQIGLFRNKAIVNQKKDQVQPSDKKAHKHVLMLDEADKGYFDSENNLLNFSSKVYNEAFGDISWIYSLLMQYIKSDNFTEAYANENINRVYSEFREYVKTKVDYKKKIQLLLVDHEQIESWLEAAIIASKLEENIDFEIRHNQLKATMYGMRRVSLALVKHDNVVSKGSTYSNGVQQCLHARLKAEKQAESPDQKSTYQTDFLIEPESAILFSSTFSSWLDGYDQIIGLTGTAGSELERAEILERRRMLINEVPSPVASVRQDLPSYLAANAENQLNILIAEIKQAIRENRPVLIVAENDIESKKIFDELFKEPDIRNQLQRIHAGLSKKEQRTGIKNAAKPGTVTVSTSMLGRGTDIKLINEQAKEKGLLVLGTYLPRTRDQWQIFGRAGRFGQAGSARLILDLVRLKKQLKLLGNELQDRQIIDLFLDRNAFLSFHQSLLDKHAQNRKVILEYYNQFRKEHAEKFFELSKQVQDPTQQTKLYATWVRFSKRQAMKWSQYRNQILELLAKPTPEENEADQIIKLMNTFFQNYQERFTQVCTKIPSQEVEEKHRRPVASAAATTHSIVSELKVEAKEPPEVKTAAKIIKQADENRIKKVLTARPEIPQAITYGKWDPAHAGQNIVYHTPFAEFRAQIPLYRQGKISFADLFLSSHKRASQQQRGLLDPELMAIRNKKRPLFANTKAWLSGGLPLESVNNFNRAQRQLTNALQKREANPTPLLIQAKEILTAVQELRSKARGKELDQLTEVLDNTTWALKDPIGNIANYAAITARINSQQTGNRLKDAMLVFLGMLVIAVCVAAVAISWGVSTPLSAVGISWAVTLIGKAISTSIGAIVLSATTYGVVKEVSQNSYGKLHHSVSLFNNELKKNNSSVAPIGQGPAEEKQKAEASGLDHHPSSAA